MIHALDGDVMKPNDGNPHDVNRDETNQRLYHSQQYHWEIAKSNVLEVVQDRIGELEAGTVPVEDLVKTRKTSKPLEAYNVENRSVSALKRARHHGIDMKSGQSVKFVVRNDDADPMDRTRLDFEAEQGEYDSEFYKRELIRAAESILSPIGMDREDIRSELYDIDIKKINSYI
jgi:DNA polymerase I